jgi:hypothetical protein
MKPLIIAALLGAVALAGSPAMAGPDDAKWIARCLQDNKDEKVAVDVITKYCTCMNNKMSENETRSITEWEKSNPEARRACDRESGWR